MSSKTSVCYRLTCPVTLDYLFWRYAAMYKPSEQSFLLDSGMDPDHLGKFSFLGGNPSAVLRAWPVEDQPSDQQAAVSLFKLELKCLVSPDGTTLAADWSGVIPSISCGDPFVALREMHHSYYPDNKELYLNNSHCGPFGGGLVGAFGYGLAHAIENLNNSGKDHLNLPHMIFMVADEVLTMDHKTGQAWVTVTGRGSTTSDARQQASKLQSRFLKRLNNFAEKNLDEVVSVQTIEQLAKTLPPRDNNANSPMEAFSLPLAGHFDRSAYTQAVQKCRDHIFRGDIFEVCLTHQLEASFTGSSWALYQILRHINPAPFAAWLKFPDFQVASASPERFLKLNAQRLAESRPIKGTRARGKTAAQDQEQALSLASSEKDRAENVMIVDLVRNDLGKVCRQGSVTVPEMLVVEKYSTVFQLVSTVQGILNQDLDAFDLVRACFPGGSMTGAPKIEAMQIIDSLEPVTRGLYSGAIGYIDASGVMDLNIIIRTMLCQDNRVTFGIGGAIVADSDPLEEYRETLDKAQALVDALTIASNL